MAWQHYQLVMLAQMVVAERWLRVVDIEVRIIALGQRLNMTREQVWFRIERLANGAR